MKDVERMTAYCHHGTFGTALPANANVNFRACNESLIVKEHYGRHKRKFKPGQVNHRKHEWT